MKIVFLCGSLAPGCDGVGDYVRRLAEELAKQGNEIGAVALNDHHVTEQTLEAASPGTSCFTTLRIPSALSEKSRFAAARTWIAAFNPDWISLQFVIFAYHPKGLPFGIPAAFAGLTKGWPLHIMFHELWVGMSTDAPSKYVAWGWVQKRIITSLLHKLQPTLIHTQTKLYQSQLARMGYTARYLPLFSNIPVADSGAGTLPAESDGPINLVVFGTIHPGAPIEQFAAEAAAYARATHKQISLIIVGRTGTEQERWATVWKAAGLQVDLLGEQPASVVSQVLSKATIGVSTTPAALIEKSGTVAAMREHGLPVLIVSKPWETKFHLPLDESLGIVEYSSGLFESGFGQSRKVKSLRTVSTITEQLIKDLASSTAYQTA